MDNVIQVHQGWIQIAVLGIGILVWGWRVISSLDDRIDRKLEKIHDRLLDLEKGQVRLEGRMDNLERRMDKIESKLDSGDGGVAMAAFKQLTLAIPGMPGTPPRGGGHLPEEGE